MTDAARRILRLQRGAVEHTLVQCPWHVDLVEFAADAHPTFLDLAQIEIDLSQALGGKKVDVRTPEEFSSGHIDGAINIPYDQIDAKLPALNKTKKDENILVYCRSGRRSEAAKQTLLKLGYKNVQNGGGMDDLMAKLRTCKTETC